MQRLKQDTPDTQDFKVADMALAAFGRREINLAEQEMPGLMACIWTLLMLLNISKRRVNKLGDGFTGPYSAGE